MDFQFYPTPPALARRAWAKFKNKEFVRVLECSAGEGHLAVAGQDIHGHSRSRHEILIDCCEIDPTKHCILREHHLNVVGLDFLQFGDGSLYSHLILNPPFAEGVKHVLKAWNILWDGEIVAILNAETVRNPLSAERRFLANLIEQHGEVEFVERAFAVEEAERKTEVDVAIVWLKKTADTQTDIIGNLFAELRQDHATDESLAAAFREDMMPALPNSAVENAVLAFNAAVRSMRDSVFAQARERYYSALLGETMAVRNSGSSTDKSASVSWVQSEIGSTYSNLKDRAWAGILRGTNVTQHLSSAAQKRVESEFEEIKKLEFTISNVYGFLCGLMEKQGEIQIDMACDVFDLFMRYHTDNAVFYKGWKSNDRHRTCGMRLRTTRIVLPGHKTESYHSSLPYDSERLLADFDKVFAMLDGRRKPEIGLMEITRSHFRELRNGQRVSSSYFDLRMYPGAGTLHFFPRDKALVDRLNRVVGRHRQWLPPEGARVSDAFWIQYDSAEKFDKELRAEVSKMAAGNRSSWAWAGPLQAIVSDYDENQRDRAERLLDEATTAVLERHGITVDFKIETEDQNALLLEAAA